MAADNPRVTNAELAELFRGLDIRTQEILLLVENVRAEQLTETRKLWNAFGSIGGLDGIGNGVAEIAGMLGLDLAIGFLSSLAFSRALT